MDIITKCPTFYQNEHKLPLNHLSLMIATVKKIRKVDVNKDLISIRNNLEQNYDTKHIRIPALDPHWIQKSRSYHIYQPYCIQVNSAENACFLEQNLLFLQSIQFLLSCTYQQFWCYMLYEERITLILDSFVMNAVPWYELNHLGIEHKKLYYEVYDSMARVYCRMLNDKESETEYMTEPHKSDLMFRHKLLTFRHIIQLILLYEKTNKKLVQQLMRTCEHLPEKLFSDIEKMFEHVKMVFDIIRNQFSSQRSNVVVSTWFIKPRPAIFDPNWFDELALYILDTAATLNSFLKNSVIGLKAAATEQLHLHIARFYNETFPLIYQAFEDQGDLPENMIEIKQRIFENIAMTRMEFVNIFHQVMMLYLNKIQMNRHELDEEALESYLTLITNILEEDFFIFDYHNSFRIDGQFEAITEIHSNVDRTRLNYVKQCLCNLPELSDLLEKHMFNHSDDICEQNAKPDLKVPVEIREKPKTLDDDEVERRIREVMDTLPDLGDAYTLECLQHYNFSTTDVISAILDDTIPLDVIMNPSHAIRVPPEQPEPREQPILAYKGKKPTYKDAKDMLDDKSEVVTKIRERILKAGNVAYDPYDDEYDDRDEDGASIAAHNRRVREKMADDESDPYKYMQNRFADMNIVSELSSSDEAEAIEPMGGEGRGNKGGGRGTAGGGRSEEPSGSGRQNKAPYRKPDFCVNPEQVRERWAASGRGGRPGTAHDVTGRPRGEGQDANVQHNREKKSTHKSSRANHSRKSGAAFKRSKGMVP